MLKKELFSNAIGSNIRVNCSLTTIVLTPIVYCFDDLSYSMDRWFVFTEYSSFQNIIF